jgi:predicted CoA-binding protein
MNEKKECEIPKFNADDKEIEQILKKYKNIAVVGASPKEDRPSYMVTKFLIENGYVVFPVNPNCERILSLRCYKTLSEIPKESPVEIVDIFRKPEEVKPIVEEAIKVGAKVIWMQEGVVNNEAAEIAIKNGLQVVMNKCIKSQLMRINSK